ncbi:glioma tumor suppressor candidate region gene 1 protein-like [Arapaima gigas]
MGFSTRTPYYASQVRAEQANATGLPLWSRRCSVGSCKAARAGLYRRPRAACISVVSVDMDDEDGRCLLDVICDPQALNDFLHGSETHLDADDLLDSSADPSSSFFSGAGGHVPEVQPSNQLSANVPAEVPSGSVDLDFLEDDDILGGSPSSVGNSGGIGTNHEPCDILQQSLAEANITEQSLQEAEAELDLASFTLSGLTQVVQALPDSSLPGGGGAAVGMDIEVGIGGSSQIFSCSTSSSTATPPNATTDMIAPVLAHPGLQLQPQGVNKAISVQPFMQQVGLGNVTLQPISSLQALPNGSQSGHMGIGQFQVVGQPTVMAINQSGQPILAKTIGGYQLQQPAPEPGVACTQAGLGGSLLSSAGGGGLLIQGSKTTLGSPALNGASIGVSSTTVSSSSSSSSSGSTLPGSGGLVGFSSASVATAIAGQQKPLIQGSIMQNIVIQRTPTPIQPKPPQGGVIQPRIYKPQQQISAPNSLQNDSSKGLGVQPPPVPVSTGQNVAFLSSKPNVVLSAPTAPQSATFPQALFKQQAPAATGKPLSVHLLNQSGSIVIPSQAVLQGQNQFLLPHLQAGGQILAPHPGGHIITSQGPNGQLITNQILATNQNLSLGQVLTSQGHSGTAHILSGPIQLQPSQMAQPTLFQMPVSLAQTQTQPPHPAGPTPTVIQGMPIQNSLAMLSQVEGLSPAVSLQPPPQQLIGGIPSNGSGVAVTAQCQPVDSIAVLGSSADQTTQAVPPPSVLTVQTASPVSVSVPPSTLPASLASSTVLSDSSPPAQVPSQTQQSSGKLLLTQQGSSMILSHESLQMFLQQEQQKETASPRLGSVPASVIVSSSTASSTRCESQSAETWLCQNSVPSLDPSNKTAGVYQIPSTGQQQQVKVLATPSSQPVAVSTTSSLTQIDSPQPGPLVVQQIQSPHHQPPTRPPSQPQPPSQSQSQSQPLPSSQSCMPSSLPPLFIIHNQISNSPQNTSQTPSQLQQPQIQVQLQTQSRPPSRPAPFQPDMPPSSDSPRLPQAVPIQFQFTAPSGSTPTGTAVKQQAPLQSLNAEQQQNLQLVGARFQTLPAVTQSSPQQKPLLDRMQQVGNLPHLFIYILKSELFRNQPCIYSATNPQAVPQPLASKQFSPQADMPASQIGTSSVNAIPVQLAPVLQPTSVLVKTPAMASSEMKTLALGSTGTIVKQGVVPVSLTQSGQTAALVMPFAMQPSKEARMLEQLRKQQGSVLHPDYSSPFSSFQDAFHRLIPYHLYQGTPSSLEDNHKVDEEFETVSNQLLKRTQAMIDKYRQLLFEESKRLGPSAEMVMIDRMFIMEEKTTLTQERVLAKERPEEYAALQNSAAFVQRSLSAEHSTTRAFVTTAGVPNSVNAPVLSHVTPTKLVIKHSGGSTSVSWSTSSVPAGCSCASLSSIPTTTCSNEEDEDALPQRSNRPPMKTYEARQRIGLKLKIKQEAGLSKVVHNTALDPVHTQPHHHPNPQSSPLQHQQSSLAVPMATVTNRTSTCKSDSSAAVGGSACSQHIMAPSTSASSAFSSTSSFSQVNGTLEHRETGGCKQNQEPPAPPPTLCRLPLRKTYRKNVSPPVRPGVLGGEGGAIAHHSLHSPIPNDQSLRPSSSPSPPAQTVIASVKLENHSSFHNESCTNVGGGAVAVTTSSPALMQELAEVEEVFNRGMIKKCPRQHLPPCREEDTREDGTRGGIRSSGGGRDPFIPAKRHKSDSPDMDNASFSSGSPPPDDSLNEHLQSAIDSILNLQQGAGRTHVPIPPQASVASYRAVTSSASASLSQDQNEGDFSRGQNGQFLSQTYSR